MPGWIFRQLRERLSQQKFKPLFVQAALGSMDVPCMDFKIEVFPLAMFQASVLAAAIFIYYIWAVFYWVCDWYLTIQCGLAGVVTLLGRSLLESISLTIDGARFVNFTARNTCARWCNLAPCHQKFGSVRCPMQHQMSDYKPIRYLKMLNQVFEPLRECGVAVWFYYQVSHLSFRTWRLRILNPVCGWVWSIHSAMHPVFERLDAV